MISRTLTICTEILLMGCLFFACQSRQPRLQVSDKNTSPLIADIRHYYVASLDSASYYLEKMDSSNTLELNQQLWKASRKWYKIAEPLIIAFDHENYKTINGPNLLKVEIDDYTDIKKIKPKGYQVLEELLFSDEPLDNALLQHNLIFLKARIPFMVKNNLIYKQSDRHMLKMIRDAVVNIATKGITGFDSPVLHQSLVEATHNYETIGYILSMYSNAFGSDSLYKAWQIEIERTRQDLKASDFEDFDRYTFIKEHTNHQLLLINKTSLDWDVHLKKSRPLNPLATNLFDQNFLNVNHFASKHVPESTPERVVLGQQLFNDTNLSRDKQMSCATCHRKELAFTDGLMKSLGNDKKEVLRNAPTLTYAALQRSFFYDGMASHLEDQVNAVFKNTREFHVDMEKLLTYVKSDSNYIRAFQGAYGNEITDHSIRNALSIYVRSLSPFNSRFDQSMTTTAVSLTEEEITGFNLFMGKAACATCHFPPAFNGTIPPKYSETEFENLGVPNQADFDAVDLAIDKDPGKYFPYKVEERRSFFKTATVRNISKTAPYMHNGIYQTLEEVMHFYNVGGGVGLGLDVPTQTLPPDSLQLNPKEINAVIAFLKTLDDESEY